MTHELLVVVDQVDRHQSRELLFVLLYVRWDMWYTRELAKFYAYVVMLNIFQVHRM